MRLCPVLVLPFELCNVEPSKLAPLSLLNSSARFRSLGRGPALGGGEVAGVCVAEAVRVPQPLRFSLAQEPQEEK